MWYRGRGARPRLRVTESMPVVPPSFGSSSASCRGAPPPFSISVVDCRTRPSHMVLVAANSPQSPPPPRPLFPDDQSHLRCRPRRYCPAGGRALPPQRRFRELQSVPHARLLGGWRPWLVRNIGMRGVHTAIGCDSEMQIMKDGVTTRNLCRRISPPNDDAPEPLPRTCQPCHSNG